jgi:hypothetical protein
MTKRAGATLNHSRWSILIEAEFIPSIGDRLGICRGIRRADALSHIQAIPGFLVLYCVRRRLQNRPINTIVLFV